MDSSAVTLITRALFRVSIARKECDAVERELFLLTDILSNNRTAALYFRHPNIPMEKKIAVLDDAVASESLRRCVRLLVRREYMSMLESIYKHYVVLYKEHRSIVDVEMKLRYQPVSDNVSRLKEKLAEKLQKKVVLSVDVDPAIVGGVWMRMGTTIYDGTFRRQLRQMEKDLR